MLNINFRPPQAPAWTYVSHPYTCAYIQVNMHTYLHARLPHIYMYEKKKKESIGYIFVL